MKKTIFILATILGIGSLAFISCSKNNDEQGRSTLNVRLTDAPTAYEEVNVDIREVKVRFSEDTTNTGWVTLTTSPGIYKLLDLQNGVDTLLATGVFPFSTVREIRFVLGSNNTIKDAGVVYPLTVPSGAESGLKLKIDHALNETLETIVIDFDAALSVTKDGTGDYKLRPVLRIK
ncbi:MAG TPA: DUF4382 domain-containing protein [Ferruginibacter sp.]|nr:DUF4382 domain-containing protein [Ferruginibacter sp.]